MKMMGAYQSLKFFALRLFRYFLDFSTSLIFGFVYGKPKPMPPIRDQILLQPAIKLAEKIRKKQLKSEEVVSAYILRIREIQPIVNAIVENRFEEALAEARRVDELIASDGKSEDELRKSTPLLGVPFSVKEHISVKGMHCTSGMVALKDNKSNDDAEVVRLMRKAGGIPIATTNVPELCMWWESSNNVYGITSNPFDTRRTCGGSSGGEGALIGSAGSVVGIGSDIGGSIRLPAVMNGIFGHKPSSGAVSRAGVKSMIPEEVEKFSVIGPMCRYAVDLLPAFKIMTQNNPKLRLDTPVDFRKLKIYYADDLGDPLASSVKPAVKNALKMALNHFQDLYDNKPIKVNPKGLNKAFELWNDALAEAKAPPFAEALALCKGKINVIQELLKWVFRMSDYTLHALYFGFMDTYLLQKSPEARKKSIQKFQQLKAQFNEILGENCVFLFPTQPEPAPFRHETLIKYRNIGYTGIFNVLLYPSTHIPMILCNGLPVGIQCVANLNNDYLTIAVATELESAFGGWTSPSPIA